MTIAYVVPCGAGKLDRPASARQLYTGSQFRHILAAAEAAAEDGHVVLILSALYGLVDLEAELEPYDLRMTDPHSVLAISLAIQLVERGITEVYALLPAAYYRRLREAGDLVGIIVWDVYEGARGCGDHKFIGSCIQRAEAQREAK
jgi:hypothetical protein